MPVSAEERELQRRRRKLKRDYEAEDAALWREIDKVRAAHLKPESIEEYLGRHGAEPSPERAKRHAEEAQQTLPSSFLLHLGGSLFFTPAMTSFDRCRHSPSPGLQP
jgi:hypothetical protein